MFIVCSLGVSVAYLRLTFAHVPKVVVDWPALLLRFRNSRIQVSTQRPAILTEDVRGIPILKANARIVH